MAHATIRDVARRAQVSVASVSRVLNGLDNVSEETRARVAAAVKELGYVPHAGARSLSRARAQAIGVVLPDLHGEFFSEIVRGMDRQASERGYLMLLSNLHASRDQAASALRAMRGRVDGLLVMAPHLSNEELAAAVPHGFPVVLMNSRGDGDSASSIRLDNAAGVRAIAEHLLGIGRRRIVHIAGPAGNIDAQERCDALRTILGQHPEAQLEVVEGDFSEESGEAETAALIRAGRRFDALFAANDNMAIGALQALRSAGVAVPQDVAVAGFDDIPLARHLGLTTVRVRISELGERAFARVIDIVEGRDSGPDDELHKPELVARATTGPLRRD